jgi:Kef-type K+ transport system membrane component KefB
MELESFISSAVILLMQDLAIVPMLAFIPVLAGPETFSVNMPGWKQFGIILSLFLLVWGFGKYVVPFVLERMARQRNREGFLMITMLAVFLSAWAMHQAGLSLALGAFLIGMFLSGCRYSIQIEAYIEPYKGMLISLFLWLWACQLTLDQSPPVRLFLFNIRLWLSSLRLSSHSCSVFSSAWAGALPSAYHFSLHKAVSSDLSS